MIKSPSLAYNRDLCFQFMQKAKVHSRYPRVSEQVECLPLETHNLFAGAYNPTINENGWMAYRFPSGPYTRLGLARLSENYDGHVLSNTELETGNDRSDEDPKMFQWCGHEYLSFVDSGFPKEIKAIVKFGKITGGKLSEVEQPDLAGNDNSSCQKNWVFFSRKYQLYVIQWCSPTQKIYWKCPTMGSWGVDGLLDTPGPKWTYGAIKGGTAPLEYNGKLLRFFHSRTDNESVLIPRHRYFIGACLMNPDPPFETVTVSKKPVIYGSEVSGIKHSEQAQFPHYKKNIVFPGGAIQRGDGWILALGENDSRCVLARIRPEQLNF